MKKVYLSIAACLFASITCVGQVLYGVQGSFQSANVALSSEAGALGGFDVSSIKKSLVSFRAGVMVDIPVTDRLSVRPQLLYSTKGYRIDFSGLLGSLGGGLGGGLLGGLLGELPEIKARINYLELPVQAMYGVDAGPGRVVLGAGPYLAYALNSSVNGESMAFVTGSKRLDFGANLSVGYELPAGLSLSAYYSHGFTNLIAPPANGSIDPTEPTPDPAAFAAGGIYNRTFGFTLGYFFGTGN